MKHLKKTVLASAVSLCLSGGAMAASWELVQSYGTVTTNVEQGPAEDSIQGINTVYDLAANADVVNVDQDVVSSTSVSFTQGNSGGPVSGSLQGGNIVYVPNGTVTLLDQDIEKVLKEDQVGNVSGSKQAANYIEADVIVTATQTVTPAASVILNQDVTGSGNKQALNEAIVGTTLTDLSQDIAGTPSFTLNQGATVSGGSNIQAVNDVNGSALVVDGTVSQTINAGAAVALNQNAAAGNHDEQAGNRLDTGGGIVAASGQVTQLINGDGSTTLDLIQISPENNIIQAGNLIKVVGTEAGSSVEQTVQNIDTADFVQDGTDHAIQAGNAIISNTPTTSTIQATQNFSAATSVDLIQTDVNDSVQSVNLAGVFEPLP